MKKLKEAIRKGKRILEYKTQVGSFVKIKVYDTPGSTDFERVLDGRVTKVYVTGRVDVVTLDGYAEIKKGMKFENEYLENESDSVFKQGEQMPSIKVFLTKLGRHHQ